MAKAGSARIDGAPGSLVDIRKRARFERLVFPPAWYGMVGRTSPRRFALFKREYLSVNWSAVVAQPGRESDMVAIAKQRLELERRVRGERATAFRVIDLYNPDHPVWDSRRNSVREDESE